MKIILVSDHSATFNKIQFSIISFLSAMLNACRNCKIPCKIQLQAAISKQRLKS